jgi:hypothetical protein
MFALAEPPLPEPLLITTLVNVLAFEYSDVSTSNGYVGVTVLV